MFLSLHSLGQRQSDNPEKQPEPDTADAEADILSADKAKRPAVLQGTKDTGTSLGDGKPSPKIHIDQSAATRPAAGATMATNTPNVIAGTSAQDAAISAGSASEEALAGDNAVTSAEPSKSAVSGRASNDALKQSGASRATVSAEQNFPAPALQNVSQAARDVLDAIASNASPARAASAAATGAQNGSPVAVPAHILKIELHPAELGTVTANLRLAGEQLSIELKPDSYEAHRRLSSDSEAIVKSLKSLGFDIDKVTILQPSIASTPAARADAPQAGTSSGRDQSSFQPGNFSGNGDGTNGQSGRNRGDDRQSDQRSAPPSQDRPGRGLFI
ncbi:MAG TPA: flagellar hook-length control protein FliK [Mesorhizobium sp.]|uniref:flagellar hook-length control protein FliK n=1 Tax=Mesorhizobium sp. TaxID=1871066 RepID=UPI002DDD6476|nr:flagellar hook-length control protein FliK [Mesorhizobium sp.]HEV2507083.1 flagellar hook-length control protein FliK [Mesorhizobium sp.]